MGNCMYLQVERPPVQTDNLKKAEKPLPSDSQRTPLNNAPTTTDSEPEEPLQQGGKWTLKYEI